jgi:hypothetical protein
MTAKRRDQEAVRMLRTTSGSREGHGLPAIVPVALLVSLLKRRAVLLLVLIA